MSTVDKIINWDSPKFIEENRNFKTRLLFLREIFTNTFPQSAILGRCIQYKLNTSLDRYLKSIEKDLWNLNGCNPISVLREIDKK